MKGNGKASGRRVVIVGAGPGGLAAAMLLRRMGCEVTLLEKQDRVGGRTGAFKAEGYTFDIGPTFFLYPRVIEEIFSFCGFDLWTELDMRRIDPLYRVAFEDGQYLDAVAGEDLMAREISRIAPADAENLARFMQDNRAKLEKFRSVLENPFQSILEYLRPDVLAAIPLLKPHIGLDTDLQGYFRDPRVRRAFSFQAKYLGMSPFNCPSLFTILGFLEHEHGVWHPIGGCNAVMQKMGELAGRMGVDIRLGEGVESVEFEGRRATGVRTAKAHYAADAVVMNADFAQSMTRLVPQSVRRRWTDRKIDTRRFSCSTFMLYLGIRGPMPNDLQHHTILLSEDFHGNIDEIQTHKVLPTHPSIYVQNASRTDPTLAPEGHSTLYVLVPVPHMTDRIDWRKEAKAFRARILERLALVGVTGLEERICYEKMFTPLDWNTELDIYRGATFNLSHNLGQMLYFRPHNRFEDADRLYLVGGGTHPGSGLPVIFESARISSRLLAQDLGL